MATTDLPYADRRDEDMPGHWILAKLGKRVLRPGGLELTEHLLADADLARLAITHPELLNPP